MWPNAVSAATMPVLAAALVLGLSAGSAWSEDPIGFLKRAEGDVRITSKDGTSRAVAAQEPLREGDVLTTGEDGAFDAVFFDNSQISALSDTELEVREYQHEPERQEGSFLLWLESGLIAVTSGLIATLSGENMSIKTESGHLAVRGTRFIVRVPK